MSSVDSFWDASPLLLWNRVLVDVDVVSESVQRVVEDQGGVHKAAGVDQSTLLHNSHLLDVEKEAPIEDLEGQSTFASEDQNFFVGNLVGQAHVGWDPLGLFAVCDVLPNVPLDVVNLNDVNNLLLVNSAAEREKVLVLKAAKGDAGPWYVEGSYDLPFIFLGIVFFAVAVYLVVDKSPHHKDEVVDRADRMISMGVEHRGFFLKLSE
jgi:hypothetical protein